MLGVAAGVAWAVGGIRAVGTGALAVLCMVPALVVVTGVLILLRSLLPGRALVGPIILIVGGSVALAIQFEIVTPGTLDRAGPALLVAGGVLVAMSRHAREDPQAAIVRRHWSLLVPVRRKVLGTAPHKLILRCLAGDLMLDLTEANYPNAYRITVDITVLAGWLELRVPDDWTVRAGRLDLTRGTRFDGDLNAAEPVPEIPEHAEYGQRWVVLNVQGWLGRVGISKSHPAGSPPPEESGSAPEGST